VEYIKEIIAFFSFSEPNVKLVFWGSLILCSVAGAVGVFTFLRKRSLLGDVISHAVLPGICLAFLLGEEKNPMYLLIGATFTGWLSIYLVDVITAKSKIKTDTAIALVLSVFFGVGILLLTNIQHSGIASQSGLDRFIFGSASSMNANDVKLFSIIGVIIFLLIGIFLRGLKMLSFDEEYAKSIGFPVQFIKLVLSITTVTTVAMGVQAVGVVLMSALMITPGATARFWTNDIRKMILLAIVISGFSGVLGSAISYVSNGMPTGPWIVVVVSLLAIISAFLGTKKGILKKALNDRKNSMKILEENILKLFYQLGGNKEQSSFAEEDLIANGRIKYSSLRKGLSRLKRRGYLSKKGSTIELSKKGSEKSREIVRKHRLWELYLSKYMHLKEDHVHDDAEGIEHIINEDIERALMKELDFPTIDPHDKEIPY
jgi:manganese/zinc/iron transport system permease protein